MDNYIKNIAKNFSLRGFKKYHDIYYETQLDKLDKDKLYLLRFQGNTSFNPDIPSEFLIYNSKFYKFSNNLNSAFNHKIPKFVIKKAFAKYGNGSISEYEDNAITESKVIESKNNIKGSNVSMEKKKIIISNFKKSNSNVKEVLLGNVKNNKKKTLTSGAINFNTQKDFTLYGITDDDFIELNGYDNVEDAEFEFREFNNNLKDYLDKINDHLTFFEIIIKNGYYDGLYLYVNEKDYDPYNVYEGDSSEPLDDEQMEIKYQKEKSMINNTILPRIAKKFNLYKYSAGWTQSKIIESNKKFNFNNIKPSDMDNVITTSDKEVYADPRNDYQGHTKEWYDGFQHGYSDGYEKGYDEGYDKGWEEGIHVEQERDYF